MTEPAWQGAGTEPGLKIWRIVVGTLHSVLKQINFVGLDLPQENSYESSFSILLFILELIQ